MKEVENERVVFALMLISGYIEETGDSSIEV
jgi:hypothetical protein